MFTIDNRARKKSPEELMSDKLNVIAAICHIKGLKYYGIKTKEGTYDTNFDLSKGKTRVLNVNLADSPESVMNPMGDIFFSKKPSFFGGQPLLEDMQAVGYGDVVYLRDASNTVYIWLEGMVLLQQTFPLNTTIDIWVFALHAQDAMKSRTFSQFRAKLAEDKMFWKEIKIY